MAMIEVDGLDIHFGSGWKRTHAVRDVSFAVARGESFGLVGESGSGKSTVLRALVGLFDHWLGSVRIDGTALTPRRTLAQRKQLQMVFQDPFGSLHPRHTVDQILSEPLRIHGLDRIDRRVAAALADVGLDPGFRFRFPHQLSGGQRQRIAIARAMIVEPKVVLLDEPTSALDVSIQAEVLNLLNRLKEEHRLTYILVSHDLAVVSHMCARLAVMRQGEVVEQLDIARLREQDPAHPYTRQLLAAARGYDRSFIETISDDL